MVSLGSLALLFLKLGTLGFGGPAAHVALMRSEIVGRKKWLTDAEFLDLLGAANLIPGPSSTELAIHIGFKLAGWRGLLLAGACFILPAAILVACLAWAYQVYGALPQVTGIMRSVKPVVLAIILQAVRGLAQTSLRTVSMLAVAFAAFSLSALGMHQLLILILCGATVVLLRLSQPSARKAAALIPVLTNARKTVAVASTPRKGLASSLSVWRRAAAPFALLSGGATAASSVSLLGLFGVFLKIGAVVFGSGYVLLAFLQSDLVDNRHWLTSRQLLDAIAIGQVTPGPVFTTATFIGFLLGGVPGSIVATIAIFLPGFILVSLSGPLIPRIRQSPIAGAFLDGVTVASIGLIGWVLVVLGRATLVDPISIGIALASFVLLTRFHFNAALLIAGAALLGAFIR